MALPASAIVIASRDARVLGTEVVTSGVLSSRVMRTLLVIGCLLGALLPLTLADVSVAAGRTHATAVTRHCGSFRYGSDGSPPGPSDITAKVVSCRFARSLAYHGQAPGWRCHLAMGLEFVCRPAQGRGVVTFLGE